MRVAVYLRGSTNSQGVDVPTQLKALHEYAVKNNYEVVREFADKSESSQIPNHPAFKEIDRVDKA